MNSRHRLLLYNQLSNIGLKRSGAALGLLGVLWWLSKQGILNLGDWWGYLWGGIALTAAFFCYYLLWVRPTYVLIKPDHLLIQGSFRSIRLPYTHILGIIPSQISQHYQLDELNTSELRLLSEFYEAPCAMVRLEKEPVPRWAQRLLYTRFLFATERPGLLLLVEDWVNMTKQIETARTQWREKQTAAELPPPTPLMPNPLADESLRAELLGQDDTTAVPSHTLLLIEPNSTQNRRVQQTLHTHGYDVFATASSVEGLQWARQNVPALILVSAEPAPMDLFHLMNGLRRHRVLRQVPVLLLATREQATSTAADWVHTGINDLVLAPLLESELLFRVRTWLEVREREREYDTRIELLHDKTLSQMSELVRRGELLNFLPATVAQLVMSGQISGRTQQPFRRTKATVLFVDIVGFTDLTGRLDPSVLAELLNEYLREMTAVAIKYNGTVDKFIGDAVMVLFGAPQEADEKQQAWDAAQTAVEMLKVVDGLNLIWRSHLPRELQIRIGFNTGFSTVGVFGNELLQSYTAVGSAVNIAARLQTTAKPNSIVISATTYELIKGQINARELGYLSLKNVNEAVEAYELLALGRPYK